MFDLLCCSVLGTEIDFKAWNLFLGSTVLMSSLDWWFVTGLPANKVMISSYKGWLLILHCSCRFLSSKKSLPQTDENALAMHPQGRFSDVKDLHEHMGGVNRFVGKYTVEVSVVCWFSFICSTVKVEPCVDVVTFKILYWNREFVAVVKAL